MGTRQTGFAIGLAVLISGNWVADASAQTFDVASIRPSAAAVPFEHDGTTRVTGGTVTMRDVSIATCIKWAYGVQDSQISGPDWIRSEHYDIIAKAEAPVTPDELKSMMGALLTDRFGLRFHRANKEVRSFALTVEKSGHKMRTWDGEGEPSRQNSAVGTIEKGTTMQEFADFIAGPLQAPVVDATGLTGRYNFTLDFTPYLPTEASDAKFDTTGIIVAALQQELGLRMESKKESIEVLVIDHVERPSEN